MQNYNEESYNFDRLITIYVVAIIINSDSNLIWKL